MQKIAESAVKRHANYQRPNTSENILYAASLSTYCPHCGELVNFTSSGVNYDPARKILTTTRVCPSCQQKTHFLHIFYSGEEEIFMIPENTSYRPPLAIPEDIDIPDQLKKAYHAAVDSLNSKNYASTAVMSRRTLEGIVKYRLPKHQDSLAQGLEQLKNNGDLADSLSRLSTSIRQGGNLGAHFDMEREPDEVMARGMVDLLDYLIEYFYILPKRIEEVERILEQPETSES